MEPSQEPVDMGEQPAVRVHLYMQVVPLHCLHNILQLDTLVAGLGTFVGYSLDTVDNFAELEQLQRLHTGLDVAEYCV